MVGDHWKRRLVLFCAGDRRVEKEGWLWEAWEWVAVGETSTVEVSCWVGRVRL